MTPTLLATFTALPLGLNSVWYVDSVHLNVSRIIACEPHSLWYGVGTLETFGYTTAPPAAPVQKS